MWKFILKVIGSLVVFTICVTIFSVVIVRFLGNVLPRSVLNGLAMGTIIIVAGTLGGWVSNEYKKIKQAKCPRDKSPDAKDS